MALPPFTMPPMWAMPVRTAIVIAWRRSYPDVKAGGDVNSPAASGKDDKKRKSEQKLKHILPFNKRQDQNPG
jgi:hypothetical protein